MKKILCFVGCLACTFQQSSLSLSEGITVMSLGSTLASSDKDSWISRLLAGRSNVTIEKVMLSIDKNMNQSSAVKLHLVIVYDKSLVNILEKLNSNEYFKQIDQLIKDHPDKMKIFSWQLVAKQRIGPWITLEYPIGYMTPEAGFIFANYSTNGDHRSKLPVGRNIIITLEKNDFKVTVDKSA